MHLQNLLPNLIKLELKQAASFIMPREDSSQLYLLPIFIFIFSSNRIFASILEIQIELRLLYLFFTEF